MEVRQKTTDMGSAGEGNRYLRCSRRVLSLHHTRVMGVLNVTPDSFSDGGRFVAADGWDLGALRQRAVVMLEAGAAILDVGGESTRPGAEPVSVEEELRRVMPVVEMLLEFDMSEA